jgi:hypothetical protein
MPREELPIEVSTEQVEQYAKRLLDITSGRVEVKMRDEILDEAVDFIGKERTEMARRMEAVTQLPFALLDVESTFPKTPETEEKYREQLNQKIRNIVAASQDPGESMDLISRIWKYLGETTHGKYNSKEYRIGPSDIYSELNRYIRAAGLEPLTHDEIHILSPAIRDWKLGKSPADILKNLDYTIDYALRKAYPMSRESRLIARYRGENRGGVLSERAHRLREMKDYLEKLFGVAKGVEK